MALNIKSDLNRTEVTNFIRGSLQELLSIFTLKVHLILLAKEIYWQFLAPAIDKAIASLLESGIVFMFHKKSTIQDNFLRIYKCCDLWN